MKNLRTYGALTLLFSLNPGLRAQKTRASTGAIFFRPNGLTSHFIIQNYDLRPFHASLLHQR